MKEKKRNQNGITLVALIITIIVLLILAVVAIRAVTGDGIIAHAKNARDQYEEKAAEENALLSNLSGYITGQIGESNGGGGGSAAEPITAAKLNTVLSATSNTKLTDKNGNKITVPAGFKILVDSTTGYTSATDIDVTKGIVIQDETKDASNNPTATNGSQFVWIPVGENITNETKTATITLGRYESFTADSNGNYTPVASADTAINTYYKELATSEYGNTTARSITDFIASANSNGGYYLGRYEASTSGSTIACKANQDVYGDITQSEASAESQAMYTAETYISDLVNSYAWDTAIIFIQTFGTETDASSYASQNKSTSFAKTGVNPDKYCNIYDMSGNAIEWTTETSSLSGNPCTHRGGNYYTDEGSAYYWTSDRNYLSTDYSFSIVSFRPLLYVALNA